MIITYIFHFPLSSFTVSPAHHPVAPPHLFLYQILPLADTLPRLPTFVIYFLPQHLLLLLSFLLPFSSSIHHPSWVSLRLSNRAPVPPESPTFWRHRSNCACLNLSFPLVLFQVETFPKPWPCFGAAEAHLFLHVIVISAPNNLSPRSLFQSLPI